jgi:hypothetical protein
LIPSLSYPFNSITEKLLGIVFAEIKKANYVISITKSQNMITQFRHLITKMLTLQL